MIPITRATAHSFCRTCLQELDTVTKNAQESHEIHSDQNVIKWLSVVDTTATQRTHPRHLCHTCYAKARTFYEFREKVIVSTKALKELLKENLHATALDNLQKFCRGCLNRLKFKSPLLTATNTQQLGDWMLDCIGVRMGEHTTAKEQQFPTQLCNWCYKKLRNFVEFRKVVKDSLAYLESVLDGDEHNCMDIETMQEKNEDKTEENKSVQPEKPSRMPKKAERAIVEGMFVEQLPVLDKGDDFTEREIETGIGQKDAAFPEIKIEMKSDNYIQEQKHLKSNEHPNFELISVQEGDISPAASATRNCRKKKQQIMAKGKVKQAKNLQGFDHSTLQLNDMKEQVSGASSADDGEHEMPVTKRARHGRKRILKEENITKKSNTQKETEKKGIIKCAQCDRQFRKKIMYEGHVRRDHEGNDRPFQCTHCPNTYGMYHVMCRHMQEAHAVFNGKVKISMTAGEESAKNKPICAICCKQFSRKDHLREHLRIVHLQQRPFKCNYCEKTFGSRKVCRVHEMGHTGQRPYTCEYCAVTFRQITDLNIHREKHTTNPELLCPICKRAKSTAEELQQHITEHNERMLQCTKCGKLFRKKSHLRAHDDAVHLKLRPFKCSHCERTFALRRTCRTHERIHAKPNKKITPKAK